MTIMWVLCGCDCGSYSALLVADSSEAPRGGIEGGAWREPDWHETDINQPGPSCRHPAATQGTTPSGATAALFVDYGTRYIIVPFFNGQLCIQTSRVLTYIGCPVIGGLSNETKLVYALKSCSHMAVGFANHWGSVKTGSPEIKVFSATLSKGTGAVGENRSLVNSEITP